MSEAAIVCPKCGSSALRSSRRMSVKESFRALTGDCPFRCLVCGERFWASLWLFSMWKWAKCPRCLNLQLTDWPKRRIHMPLWHHVATTLGARRHRCSACRVNFVSFRPRMPDTEGDVPEENSATESPSQPAPPSKA